MDSLTKHIEERKKKSEYFAKNFDTGYEEFKVGVMLKIARQQAGLTQNNIANRLNTSHTAISRMENHAEDIKLSTLEKYARALNKRLEIRFI